MEGAIKGFSLFPVEIDFPVTLPILESDDGILCFVFFILKFRSALLFERDDMFSFMVRDCEHRQGHTRNPMLHSVHELHSSSYRCSKLRRCGGPRQTMIQIIGLDLELGI